MVLRWTIFWLITVLICAILSFIFIRLRKKTERRDIIIELAQIIGVLLTVAFFVGTYIFAQPVVNEKNEEIFVVRDLSELESDYRAAVEKELDEYDRQSLLKTVSIQQDHSPILSYENEVFVNEAYFAYYSGGRFEVYEGEIGDPYTCTVSVLEKDKVINSITKAESPLFFVADEKDMSMKCTLEVRGKTYNTYYSTFLEGPRGRETTVSFVRNDKFTNPFVLRLLDQYGMPYANNEFFLSCGYGGIGFYTNEDGYATDTDMGTPCVFHAHEDALLVLYFGYSTEPYELASFRGNDATVRTIHVNLDIDRIIEEEDDQKW